ncbi:unnamed protein product [Linum trigynum]|uniref:Uncharacterized protein n=1 Tax=Linum trigynum TaxID=586398 RepID=A0AAV2GT14_9ROSI
MANGLHETKNDKDSMKGLLADVAHTKAISTYAEFVDPNDCTMGDTEEVNVGTDFVGQPGNNSVIDSNDAMISDEDLH